MNTMAGAKKPLPLFELVSARDISQRTEPLPVLIPPAPAPSSGTGPDFLPREPKPLPLDQPRAARIRSSTAATTRVFPSLGGRLLVLPSTLIWIGAGCALLVVLTVWMAGTAFGRKQAELGFGRDFRSTVQQPAPEDPLNASEPAQPNPGTVSGGPSGADSKPSAVKTEKQASQITQGQVVTPAGLAPDPRQDKWNYLLLGTLPREEATAAVGFLSKNGVEAFAVQIDPVDRRLPRGNTSARFQLFASKGIPSAEFGSRQAERDRLKQDVARLGATWKRDHKGSTSFSDAFWLKN